MSSSQSGSPSSSRGPKRSALGRGLGSLIGGTAPGASGPAGRRVLDVPIEQIVARRDQPRQRFDDAALDELAASVREKGVLSPILVRRQGEGYGLIAGERRWRAAQRAGQKTVPVIVEEADDDEAFELALIENIQRQDLNPLEEADAYHRLMSSRDWTQEQLAGHLGKDRSTVANALRLLKLPESVRDAVAEGRLAMGHARALVALPEASSVESAAREVMARGLSVRQTEGLVRKLKQGAGKNGVESKKGGPKESPEIRDFIARIERSLGTRCRLDHRKGKGGRLTIEYESLDDLDRIVGRLLGES
jgi:ParB family transcriptional regulator, chromosome partitioning protein